MPEPMLPVPALVAEQSVSYSTTAALIWIIWDTIISFDTELDCIWSRPRSWAKWTYIFVRYGTLIHGIAIRFVLTHSGIDWSEQACKNWMREEIIFVELLTVAVECILIVRLYAIYDRNKVIMAIIFAAFFAEIVMMIVCMAIVLPGVVILPETCWEAHIPGMFMSYWLSSLVFEAFLFALTLFNFFRNMSRELGRRSILYTIVRDGTWAFAMIFVMELTETLNYKLIRSPLAGVGYGWSYGVMSFAGSHIILNLRLLGRNGDHDLSTAGPRTAVQFARRTDNNVIDPDATLGMTTTEYTSTGMMSSDTEADTYGLKSKDGIESYVMQELRRHDPTPLHVATHEPLGV